jgi:hypothetical protein
MRAVAGIGACIRTRDVQHTRTLGLVDRPRRGLWLTSSGWPARMHFVWSRPPETWWPKAH